MLKKLITLIKDLNGYANPNQIAFAVSFGVILGFLPKNNGIWYIMFFLLCFFRINKAAFFFITLFCSLITPFLDPFFHRAGTFLLEYQPLIPLYQTMLSVPLVPLTKFNNTIVMGSFISGILLFLPIFILFRTLIVIYRKWIRDWVKNTKVVKLLYKLPLIQKLSELSAITSEVASWKND